MPKTKPLEQLKPPGYMIRILRKKNDSGKKMSQEKLGELVGLSHATISRIEAGENSYSKEFIEKCCEIFHVKHSLLFASDEKEADILKALHKALK